MSALAGFIKEIKDVYASEKKSKKVQAQVEGIVSKYLYTLELEEAKQKKVNELVRLYRDKNNTMSLVVHGSVKAIDADLFMKDLNQQIKVIEEQLK